MIAGEMVNRASLARYANIELKIVYVTSQGKKKQINIALLPTGVLDLGGRYKYKYTLFDLFSKKSEVNIQVNRAEVKK